MSFDRLERTTATVDPDKQVVASENKADDHAGRAGRRRRRTTPRRRTRILAAPRATSSAPGTIKRLTVAVLVADQPPATAARPSRRRARRPSSRTSTMLVRSAVGADSARGDVVSVVSVPFAPAVVAPPEAPKTDIVNVMQTAQRPLLGVDRPRADHRRRAAQPQVAQGRRPARRAAARVHVAAARRRQHAAAGAHAPRRSCRS